MPSKFPNSIDDASSLYSPADAFSAKPLETITTMPVYAGDTTISVESTGVGFPDEYGILSIDDELIVYTGKTATQFTGCQRGAFGTVAAQHTSGATVRANMVSAYIKALQEAVVAIEQDLGTASSRNYVRKDGAVTMTGQKSFVDGAEFGSGNKAATGLVRLPNTGAVKWRKADGSGDLGLALNANDRLVADAIIDFAPGQTFGAFSYPDAGYGNKGIVQIDPAGGLAVESGVLSMAPSGASPGTYPKVTVDAKGRVTAGANLAAGDLPGHTHTASDIVSGELPHKVQKDGADVGTRRALNLVQGTRVSLAAADDPANDRVSVTISASPPEAGEITNALGYVPANRAGDHFTGPVDCGPHQTIGGPLENMAKHSEDFAAATWDKNGGSCSVTSNAIIAPDGNQTADVITAVTDTPVIQQQIAGLVDGGTYTFYIWARVASGTRKVSIAIVDNAYAAYLAGPTQITLTTPGSASRSPARSRAARQACGSWSASTPATATTGPPATSTSGAPASSRAMIRRKPTPAPGPPRRRTSPPASPPARPSSPRRTPHLTPQDPRPRLQPPRQHPPRAHPRTANSSSPAAPATATASPNSAPPTTPPAGRA
jgi:hypothetical protein